MQSLVLYFETIPALHRSLILFGGMLFFYLIEYAAPLFNFNYRKLQHAGINLLFTLTTIIINFLFAFTIVKIGDWSIQQHIGILTFLNINLLWYTIIGLLLLDLIGAYTVHYVEHKIKWMWRFHLIHHSDTHIDTTSANRHHPGESVFRLFFTVIAVGIIGAPIWLVMMYQSASVVLSQFNHANIRLPLWLDKTLSWVIVSPNMHKVHHHYVQPYTDSNYGNIFSIWDRIFGTYTTLAPEKITYGIDTHMLPEENNRVGNLFTIPFQPYRAPKGSKFN
ncbi:MAG: sterol desaturase family protein [Chitinophagales bacterium]|jgi:sterol desaturase/sphingolipid hydroxylase (fatty acid hydroxylase superfamily)|nr:sterol desaturase family protein [Bacteroidota bacterium]MBK9557205.1 sterol desaturase family protein [Bacteroidota bacterium]MBP8249985.1 sterol desaturase family protein [Chitinophagales bacterium]